MLKAALRMLWLVLALTSATGQLVAAQTVISGVITDDAGKPIRGATVTATSGIKSFSRYSQNDGRYEIAVPSGNYDVAVDAFGFALKRESVDTAQSGRSNFSLTPKIDVTRFTGAEIEGFLPDNAQTRLIRRACFGCHTLQTVMKMRGLTAAGWQAFLPTMTRGRLDPPDASKVPLLTAAVADALGKYFGPDALYLGPKSDPPKPEQIKHAKISDVALSATVTEYQVPTPGAMPNNVIIDQKGRPWWTQPDSTNEVGELDLVTDQFHMYPMPPNTFPKDSVMGKDGSAWFALSGKNNETKLARVNPDTGEVIYYKSDDLGWHDKGPNTLYLDPKGNIWSSGRYPAHFNIKKGTFKVYQFPYAKDFSERSVGSWADVPGLPKASPQDNWYTFNCLAVDSKGIVYLVHLWEGTIMRLDPATGQTKYYDTPGIVSPHGIVVDNEDNVWFCDDFGGTLDKLDTKLGAIKRYHPPTENANPGLATFDKRSGYIYFPDDNGNNVTRFDPKTEKFVEYPLPTPESMPRAVGIDTKGRIWYGAGGPFAAKIGVIDPGTKDQ